MVVEAIKRVPPTPQKLSSSRSVVFPTVSGHFKVPDSSLGISPLLRFVDALCMYRFIYSMASYTAEQFNSFKEKFQADVTDSSWLFGVKYDTSSEDGKKIFLADFRSHIWVSYRKNFVALMPSRQGRSFTSDTGWGCMIRSGQMMLAEALLRSRLGRGWRIDSGKKEGQEGNIPIMSIAHDRTILEFVDVPQPKCNFSIHRIVHSGLQYGKNPGDWYGPETISVVLRD